MGAEELHTAPEEVPDLSHLYQDQDFIGDIRGVPLDKKDATKARM